MKLKLILAAISAGVLVACGGGGGGAGGGGDAPIVPGWQSAQALESLDLPAQNADVAINANGVGYAVWAQISDGVQTIFVSRYSSGAWSPAQLVSAEAHASGPARNPQVVVLPDGEALVLWAQSIAGAGFSVMSKLSTNGGTWTAENERSISTDLENLSHLEMVANGNGQAAAAWQQRVIGSAAGENRIFFSLLGQGGLEQAQAVHDEAGTDDQDSPDIAMNDKGDILFAWVEPVTGGGGVTADLVFYRGHRGGGGLTQAAILSVFNGALSASSPSITWGPDDSALIAWSRELPGGGGAQIEAKGSGDALDVLGWSQVFVASGQGNAGFSRLNPQVVMDAQGLAAIVWHAEGLADQRDEIVAAHWNGTDWGLPQTVDSRNSGATSLPQVVADANGQAIAIWRQDDGTTVNVASARLNMASGQWSVPELIENDNTGDARNAPSLAMNASGRALATWEQTVGSPVGPVDSILANVFIK